MYKNISFRSVPKPGPGNRAGFFIARARGTPKTPWVFGPQRRRPQTQAFSGRRLPAPQTAKPAEEWGECPNQAGEGPRQFGGAGAFRGGAEHACCCACYVPVRRGAGFAFCQPVQKGDEGLPVNFTFYREPVPLLLFAARPVPAL